MSKIQITAEVDFKPGDKAYYCGQMKTDNPKIDTVTIKSIHVSTKIAGNNKRYTRVSYTVSGIKGSHHSHYYSSYSGCQEATVSGTNLYASKTEIYESQRDYKKKQLAKKTSKIKQAMKKKEAEMAKLKKEIDEIKKEELIEDLSGISTKKKRKR